MAQIGQEIMPRKVVRPEIAPLFPKEQPVTMPVEAPGRVLVPAGGSR